jgi:ribonuclease BN (tRNA processing enzyme)
MAAMRVTVIGCSGSFPGPDAEGFRLVLDLGNGALGVLQRYAALFGVDAICLSHLHADHCVDLGAYWVARQYTAEGPRPPIAVYGPPGTAERVAGFGGEGLERVQARFAFSDLSPATFEVGPFRITADRMNHPVETYGFRIEHAGWRLAYSADTGESDALVRLAEGADLLLCEASFLDAPDNRPNLHLSARQAAGHAVRAGAGELVLTHLVPWHDRSRSLAEAAAVYRGPLSLATSGLVLGPDGGR